MRKRLNIDWQLVIPIIIITFFGLTGLAAISLQLATTHLIFFLISAAIFLVVSQFSYLDNKSLISFYIVISLLLLISPFFFGSVVRGSIRWVQVGGLTFQPSELIKPFLIIIFGYILRTSRRQSSILNYLYYFLVLIIPFLLIFKQPDLGSALVIMAVWLSMLIVSGISWKSLAVVGLVGSSLAPLIWRFLQDYQKQRILIFFNPYSDPQKTGYHVIQSIISVGSGGLFGRGLGHGTQSQLRFLPERHTDFIFASLAEQLGFLGSITLLMVLFFLLKRILIIARLAPDKFSRLLTIGVFAMLFFQISVNIGMNLGILPITGITLPLVSSGGSSLLATMISLGLVNNISQYCNKKRPLVIK